MSASEAIGVLSVDDNPMIGDSVAQIIRRNAGLRWDGFLTSGEGVLEVVYARHPRVVLMDMDIPGTDTGALIRELAEKCPSVCVLIMSGYMQPQYIQECLENGATGYIGKDHEPEYVIDAIRRVAAGEVVISPEAQLALAKRTGRK